MDTRTVQTHLRQLGWPIGVDGSYGPRTRAAVMEFQTGFAFRLLLVDGMAGPQVWRALEESLAKGGRCSAHFAFREFASKGDGWIKVRRELAFALDRYREAYGPTAIVSGYRDPARNRAVGGKPNSQHLYGNAVDVNPVAPLAAVRRMKLFSGIGYQKATGRVRHLDVRHAGPNTTGGTPENPTVWPYP